MSDDAQAMMTGMFPQSAPMPFPPGATPPTFPTQPWIYFPEGGTVHTPEGGIAPGTVYRPPSADYSKTFSAITRAGMGIGEAGRDIGGYRSEKAMGRLAKENAQKDAYRIAQKGLKNASGVRAIAGAQGTTGAGSPLLAELQAIQAAQTDARTRLYEGNIEKYYADQRAKKYLHKAPGDLLEGLLPGAELFKEKV
jgi:hypothetical protein